MKTIDVLQVLREVDENDFVRQDWLTTHLLSGHVGALVYEHLLKSGRLVYDRRNGTVRVGEGGSAVAPNIGGIPLIAGLNLSSVSWLPSSTNIKPGELFQVTAASTFFACYRVRLAYGNCEQCLAIPSQVKSECQFTLSLVIGGLSISSPPTGSEVLKCDALIFEVVVSLNDWMSVLLHLRYEIDRSDGKVHNYSFQAVETA